MSKIEKLKKMIDDIESIEKLETFIKNAEAKGESELASYAYMRIGEFRKKDFAKGGKRPALNYLEMGLKCGDAITHTGTGEIAYIESGRTLIYKGIGDLYITNIEKELNNTLGKQPPNKPSKVWTTDDDGTTLDTLYRATYGAPYRELTEEN